MSHHKKMYSGIIEQSLVFLFVLLFVYAAVSKLVDYETFENQLGQSPLYRKIIKQGVHIPKVFFAPPSLHHINFHSGDFFDSRHSYAVFCHRRVYERVGIIQV